jgi:flagellar basal-body rod protein FlgF
MDNTLLVSLSHQIAAFRSMDVIANNLANVSTPGFKRETAKFQEYVQAAQPTEGDTTPQSLSFVQDAGIVRDLSGGPIERTNAPLDLAIDGNGYFVVKTANGDRYTRNGHFTLDPEGRIVTESGEQLQGEGGEITVTADDGDIHVAQDGTVTGLKGQLGKLRLVSFADERGLKKEGTSLYSAVQTPQPVEKASLKQGMLEASNVAPVIEISHMIEVMRAYQATATLSQSQEDLMRQAIDKLGQVES